MDESSKKVTPQNHPVTRKWMARFGIYRYSCGCEQDNNFWNYCSFHKPFGYQTVLKNLKDQNAVSQTSNR